MKASCFQLYVRGITEATVLTGSLIVSFCILLPVAGWADTTLVPTLPVARQQLPLKQVLDSLGQSYNVVFVYEDEVIADKFVPAQSLQSRSDQSFNTLLTSLFQPLGLTFEKIDRYYVIKPKPKENSSSTLRHTLTGRVMDENNRPLSGVNIVLPHTSTGTFTDEAGGYSLTLSGAENISLIFSRVGYITKEVTVQNTKVLNVALEPDVMALSEVVLIGYGATKKSDLTGAVTSLKQTDIDQGVYASVDQLLKGRAEGISVVQNNAEPGGAVSVNIRGAGSINAGNSPLYIIDGVPVSTESLTTGTDESYPTSVTYFNPLNAINPNDIESIEILKDASATAIYGARGANGVIIVTTKEGRPGVNRVNYAGYVGVQNPTRKLNLLKAQQYKAVINDILDEQGGAADQYVGEIANNGKGTDWQAALYKHNALVQSHNLSLSGGEDRVTYFSSLAYFSQTGAVISSGFDRYSGRINLHANVSDKFETAAHLTSSYSRNDLVPSQSYEKNENNGALYAAYNFDPTLSVKDDEGNYTASPLLSIQNPLALAHGKNTLIDRYYTFAGMYGAYEILPIWVVKVNVGTEYTSQRKDITINDLTTEGASQDGIATVIQNQQANYLVEGTSTYTHTWHDHYLNVMAGVSTQKFTVKTLRAGGSEFVTLGDDIADNLSLADQSTYEVASTRRSNRLISTMGRLNYRWQGAYFLTATLRMDGSSRFGANNKYGYFPSAAVAWKVTEESFTKSWTGVDLLKLRITWGRTGNQDIGNNRSLTTYTAGKTAVFNDAAVTTAGPSRLANPNLKWQTTEQIDVGIDFNIWGGRIDGSLDYYHQNTFDMLVSVPVPTSSGYTSQLVNAGSVVNRGWEMGLRTVNLSSKHFSWHTSAALGTVKNKVTSLGGASRIITGGAGFTSNVAVIENGEPLYSFYGYKIDGVWQTTDDFSVTDDDVEPGDLKFQDANGDRTVDSDDRVVLGNSFPKVTWSVSNTWDYKRLSLVVFWEGVQGVSMLNNNLVETYFPTNVRNNKFAIPYLHRWTADNPSHKYPSFVRPNAQGTKYTNSYTVEDASYTRLKTVTLSYQLATPKPGGMMATVYITAENLLTITPYTGGDPAVNTYGNANFRIDFNAYPTATNWLMGVRITL